MFQSGDVYGPWWKHPFVMFDVETTGLDAATDRIVEMAFARFEQGEVVATYGTFVYPEMVIPDEAAAIHGITNAMVASAPTFVGCLHRIAAICHGAWPAAYNAEFDRRFWEAEMRRAGLPVDLTVMGSSLHKWIDPLVWVRNENGWGGNKLTVTAERMGIDLTNAHRATDDAVAAGKVLIAMKGKMPPVTMVELLRRQDHYGKKHQESIENWLAGKRARGER